LASQPRISEAEWIVMEALWQRSPQTASDVVAALASQSAWKEATVKTMLNRLARKGALKFQAQGKRYLYRPAVTRQSAVRSQSRSFLARVFGGDVKPMLAHFVEHQKLTPRQITELRRILDTKGR